MAHREGEISDFFSFFIFFDFLFFLHFGVSLPNYLMVAMANVNASSGTDAEATEKGPSHRGRNESEKKRKRERKREREGVQRSRRRVIRPRWGGHSDGGVLPSFSTSSPLSLTVAFSPK